MLYERLVELEKNRAPITVGIIGAGTFGSQIISQCWDIRGTNNFSNLSDERDENLRCCRP
jgi:predicted homoserine dehydrogenase-like protein